MIQVPKYGRHILIKILNRASLNVSLICITRQLHCSAPVCVIKSKFGSHPIPEVTIDEYVWKDLDKWRNKTATICAETGRSYLYSEIRNKSISAANFLHKSSGLRQGDTVAIVLPNVPEYPIIFMGAVQAGLKVTTINSLYTAGEISTQLENSEAKIIFTQASQFSKVKKAAEVLKWNVKIITLKDQANEETPLGSIKFDEILRGSHNLEFTILRNPNDVVLIPYSSGTTGLPKGVSLTHKNLVASLDMFPIGRFFLQKETTEESQDSMILMLPMFHIFGIHISAINMLRSGTRVVTIPKFSTEIFLDVLTKFRPSFLYLVPPLVQLLINSPKINYSDHLSSIDTILSGAGSLREEDIVKLRQKTDNKISVIQGYGLTETSGLVTHQSKHLPDGIKLGGSGFLAPNTEAKVISIDNKQQTELKANEPGEVLVRGPQIMEGYFNNLKATREAIDSEGWFRTGDVGYYDDSEHIFITDRIKDLIKVKGFQVAPAELEAILRNHPKVEDASVIGVPSVKLGEVPKAFIVTKKGSNTSASEIEKYMAEKVASHKQLLGGVVFIDEIPKTASGKILKKDLRKL